MNITLDIGLQMFGAMLGVPPEKQMSKDAVYYRERHSEAESELSDYRNRDRLIQVADGAIEEARAALAPHVACVDAELRDAMTKALDAINRAAEALERHQA